MKEKIIVSFQIKNEKSASDAASLLKVHINLHQRT